MKFKKILSILLMFMILFSITVVTVNAADYGNIYQFEPYTNTSGGFQIVDNTINRTLGVALDIIRIVTFCIALLLLIIIGIKYMISTPEIRAELKKDLPTYFIGVIILFAASGILRFITYFVGDAL